MVVTGLQAPPPQTTEPSNHVKLSVGGSSCIIGLARGIDRLKFLTAPTKLLCYTVILRSADVGVGMPTSGAFGLALQDVCGCSIMAP